MRLCSVLFLLGLTGCASSPNTNSIDALKRWDAQFKQCDLIQESNTDVFPETPWFKSLSFEDKREVLIYIYDFNNYKCGDGTLDELNQALIHDGNESLLEFFTGFKVYNTMPDESKIQHVDKLQVDLIIDKFNKPFNISDVFYEFVEPYRK